jgi:hypothetical protein
VAADGVARRQGLEVLCVAALGRRGLGCAANPKPARGMRTGPGQGRMGFGPPPWMLNRGGLGVDSTQFRGREHLTAVLAEAGRARAHGGYRSRHAERWV